MLAVITAAGQNRLFGAGGVSVAAHLAGGVPAGRLPLGEAGERAVALVAAMKGA